MRRQKDAAGNYTKEIAIILENGLIPRVDELDELSIFKVIDLLCKSAQPGGFVNDQAAAEQPPNNAAAYKQVYFDLLATEFARKYKTQPDSVTIEQRCYVLF